MKKQKGLAMVEFALIAPVFFILIFGALEVARLLFVLNTLTEATRRGARVAVVCPVNHTDIKRITLFGASGSTGDSTILNNLSDANIDVAYFDEDGVATINYPDIDFVRVSIQNYQHTLLIPFIPADSLILNMPSFATTLPAESLGWIPDLGVRQCFGT